jgi:hypothetical protein
MIIRRRKKDRMASFVGIPVIARPVWIGTPPYIPNYHPIWSHMRQEWPISDRGGANATYVTGMA